MVNTVAPLRGAKAELMSGMGYLCFTVILLSPQSSMHSLSDPSYLSTKKEPAPTGEAEGLIIPAARESWMYLSIASCSGL